MTSQRQCRRPANRKGRRSAEYRKFESPHLLTPRLTCHSSLSSSRSLIMIPITPLSLQESDEYERKYSGKCNEETSMTTTGVAIETVVNKLEEEEEVSENTIGSAIALSLPSAMALSSSSNGEIRSTMTTTALVQRGYELQCETKIKMDSIERDQDKMTVGMKEPLRRSRRKRRTVDLVSLPAKLSSRKSLQKRRNIELKLPAVRKSSTAVSMVADAPVEPVVKEQKHKQVAAKRVKSASKDTKTSNGMLSPVQDEAKKTPKKKRSSKARRSLEPAYTFELQTEYVSKLIKELYEEQEKDDREMYNITRDTVVTETSSCIWSQEIEDLNMEEFRRLMTYGEVSVESVATTILPLLNLEEDDVFFDLGCGTGKILVQVALQTPCKRATGIELMQNRVLEGHKALKRLHDRDIAILRDKQIEIFRGDIFVPPEQARLMDATVVFINNVMFGPALMLKVMELLKDMSKLRCVITLRKICERHGDIQCTRAGNFCIEYVHPPVEAEIDVSWAHKTSVYLYKSIDYKLCELRRELANNAHHLTAWQKEADDAT